MDQQELEELAERVTQAGPWIPRITQEMAKVVIGQQYLVKRLLIGLLSDGHVLLEGVPGLAKTTTIKALANSVHGNFRRIQFTPDLLPSDIVGTLIYNSETREYVAKKGPIFANVILADEINRAPAKVQSALLEAMQEHQVTLGDTTYALPEPFLVLATQNPVEQEGTYPLPEAQVDRFMLKVVVDYGTLEEEIRIMEIMGTSGAKPKAEPVVDLDTILGLRTLCDRIYVDAELKNYIARLVFATRNPETVDPKLKGLIRYGASPRATINLVLAARAHAFLEGRAYATPFDVRSIALDVMRHRLLRTYEAEAEDVTSEQLVNWILEKVPVP
ncbi:MAG: AAA family ATPase [Candidatus Methylacidiphilales bacterium]|nr:MoxR family ATPase [Candidatus Methylacidiphilales bacterium]